MCSPLHQGRTIPKSETYYKLSTQFSTYTLNLMHAVSSRARRHRGAASHAVEDESVESDAVAHVADGHGTEIDRPGQLFARERVWLMP